MACTHTHRDISHPWKMKKKEKWNTTICDIMDGSKWYYAKLKKADIERQIHFDFTMWHLKQTNKQNKTKWKHP